MDRLERLNPVGNGEIGMKKAKKQFNLNGYIFGALRKIWRWYPERKKALDNSTFDDAPIKDIQYVCNKCQAILPRDKVHIDHVNPVIDPEHGFQTWDEYIARLFVEADGLQVLCKNCHTTKTNEENKARRK